MVKQALEESRKHNEAEQARKREKLKRQQVTITPSASAAATKSSSKGSNKKVKILSKRKVKSMSNDNNDEGEEEEEVLSKHPTPWQVEGSRFIGETCRRAIPPQFHHLVSSNMTLKPFVEDSSSYSNSSTLIHVSDGHVVAFKKAYGRTPALFRIVYPSASSSRFRYEEAVTEPELLSGITSAAKRFNSSMSGEQLQVESMKSAWYFTSLNRQQADMERHLLIKVLPHLIVAAMQEMTLEKAVQDYIADQLLDADPSSGRDAQGIKGANNVLSKPHYGNQYEPYTEVYKALRRSEHGGGGIDINDGGGAAPVSQSYAFKQFAKAKSKDLSKAGTIPNAAFQGSVIGQRLRAGAQLAYELLRRVASKASCSPNVLGLINMFEPGGRTAYTLIEWCMDHEIEHVMDLAHAASRVTAKDIQTTTMERLLYEEGPATSTTAKKAQDEEDEEESSSLPPYRMEYVSGDSEADFSRTKFILVPFAPAYIEPKEEPADDAMDVDADVPLDAESSEAAAQAQTAALQEAFAWQQQLQKRVRSLQSRDAFTVCWPKWAGNAKQQLLLLAKEQETSPTAATGTDAAINSNTASSSTGANSNGKGPETAEAPVATTDSTANDAEIAKALATQEEAALSVPSYSTDGAAVLRRPRRAARMNADGGAGASGASAGAGLMFYGSAHSMTQNQVRDSLWRLVAKSSPSFLTYLDVKALLLSELESTGRSSLREIRKVRKALLRLLFEEGRLERLYVTNLSDFTTMVFPTFMNGSGKEDETGDSLSAIEVKSSSNEDVKGSIVLASYIDQLLHTERALRALLLAALQVSPKKIAASADEKLILDDEIELDDTATTTDHALVNQCVMRPDGSKWRIVSYTPSVPLDPVTEELTAATTTTTAAATQDDVASNPLVKRRCRFHLMPSVEGAEAADGEEELTLTEAQVHAGMEALEVKKVLKQTKAAILTSKIGKASSHAMKQKVHTTLTLESVEEKQRVPCTVVAYSSDGDTTHLLLLPAKQQHSSKKANSNGVIKPVKESSSENNADMLSAQVSNLEYRALVDLFTPDPVSAAPSAAIENEVLSSSDERNGEHKDGKGAAFWAILGDNGKALEFQSAAFEKSCMNGESNSSLPTSVVAKAKIVSWIDGDMPSMQESLSVLQWIQSHIKGAPFLEPVDPEALQLPDYFDVIERPMDLSTIERNLKAGKYSDVDGNVNLRDWDSATKDSFCGDLFLMLSNAMTYNEEGFWLYTDAQWLRKQLDKKIDAALRKLSGGAAGGNSSRGRAGKAKTTSYYGDDSDDDDHDDEAVNHRHGDDDAYVDDAAQEYEDDLLLDDDDYRPGRRSRQRRKKGSSSSKGLHADDVVTKDVIETGVAVLDIAFSRGLNSYLSFLDTDCAQFSLPLEWRCRWKDNVKDDQTDGDKQASNMTEAGETSLLVQAMQKLMQTESPFAQLTQRRSTRSRDTDKCNKANGGTSSSHNSRSNDTAAPAVELFLENEPSVSGIDRVQVELVQEAVHEYLGSIFDKETLAATSSSSFPNIFHKDVFPPYLGRVCPTTGRWEIRTSCLYPALRWVIQGLIYSGHLGAEFGRNFPDEGSPSLDQSHVFVSNAYYYNKAQRRPFDLLRPPPKNKSNQAAEEEESEEEVELSEYEKARLDRVARNQERLKLLGLG
jgi:hypothetical protein